MDRFNDIAHSKQLAEIDGIFSERVSRNATPGIRYALFDRSGVIGCAGHGDGGAASLSDSSARFRIASCTKSFTAAAILVLRDRGRISLDEPVTRYAPALRPTLPAWGPEAPTLRMLLSMAGGFPTDDPWADRQESISTAALDAILHAGVRFATAPGTRYEYSNLGYALLGRVIEEVGQQPYPDFVTDNLLAPLGLDDTGFDPGGVPSGRMTTGFRKAGESWQELPFSGPGAFSSIGGMVTTTHDLARWAGWLCSAFGPDGGHGPLSAASRREMQRIQCAIAPDNDSEVRLKGYGYGLVVEHHGQHGPIASHSGGYPGFSSHMRWSLKTGLGVIAFENATYSGAWGPATAALERLLEATPAADMTAVIPPAAIQQLAAGLQRLLLDGWDDATADTIFLENVGLDRPYAERAAEWIALSERAGKPDVQGIKVVPRDPGSADSGFGKFELHVPCATGALIVKALCGPPEPLRLQSVAIELVG